MSEKEYTKHSVSTDALDTLGTIISAEEGRDAIHLAVFPIRAGGVRPLAPGEHVRIDKEGLAVHATSGEGVGIVDPFLLDFVQPDEWFWLVVYPRQITSLRHVWEHEAFPASEETGVSRAKAEAWIRAWLPTVDLPYSFEEVMEALKDGRSSGYPALNYEDGELRSRGDDAYGTVPDEFWEMAEVYLGIRLNERPTYFSCSC